MAVFIECFLRAESFRCGKTKLIQQTCLIDLPAMMCFSVPVYTVVIHSKIYLKENSLFTHLDFFYVIFLFMKHKKVIMKVNEG